MKHGRFDFEKNKPFFQPPKYTGVTLSLLSIFVLVCMLTVWKKISPEINTALLIGHAWEDCKMPLEKSRIAFEQETGIPIDLRFFTQTTSQIFTSVDEPPDFIIMPTSAEIFRSDTTNTLAEKVPLAYTPKKLIESTKEPELLLGYTASKSRLSIQSLLFLRYLSAPTRGQFDFASFGWTGVRGDRWSIAPNLLIYFPKILEPSTSQIINEFAKREGVHVDANFFAPHDMIKAIKLTSKSRAKQYLPDLVFLSSNLFSSHLAELPFIELTNVYSDSTLGTAFIGKWSTLQETARRFYKFATSPN